MWAPWLGHRLPVAPVGVWQLLPYASLALAPQGALWTLLRWPVHNSDLAVAFTQVAKDKGTQGTRNGMGHPEKSGTW